MSDALGDGAWVVVTGAARGIGASTVRAFARAGAHILALDIHEPAGSTSGTPHNGTVRFCRCDVTDVDSVMAAFDSLSGAPLDALVNCAGIERSTPAEAITIAEMNAMLAVHVTGTLLTNQAAFARMRERGGSIINFTSGAALKAYPGGAHYSAAKGAVAAWTRTVAREWGRYAIRVNAVAPAVRTPMADEHEAHLSVEERKSARARQRAEIAIGGQLGDPDTDLAPVLLFLAGPGARFVTGQIIAVNGGSESVR